MPPDPTTNPAGTPGASPDIERELPVRSVPVETSWCIHCFRTAAHNWNETGWVQPFKVNCIRDAITSNRCQRCRHARDKCELLYEGIRGHGFELHALLEWVLEFWVNENSGIGQTDDAALVHGIEIVRTVAVAVRALCSALDCLIKSHGKAHNLVGKRGGDAANKASYAQYCSSGRHFLQIPPPLDPHGDGTPHPKCVKFEHCSRQNLRLATNSDTGLPWYLSILSFKRTIEDLIRNEYDHSDTNTVTWYTAMLATFPLTIPEL
ncbi:hypothetical protein N7537_007645 [Penicillium hordei]|uniref:Uncharacterized protein n=1 Tax=Penicillium hordei TaxID=40994 RepID=A0AAD6GZK7_9EURO|nr:uncharacterized protein N7537_007645 [Penicillium hordei]KAJ5597561.1 hypothetical protein N7537_007645 [Penicillium hordei]